MKKIVTAIVIFFLNSVSFANDQEKELDKLFLELKKNIPTKKIAIKVKKKTTAKVSKKLTEFIL